MCRCLKSQDDNSDTGRVLENTKIGARHCRVQHAIFIPGFAMAQRSSASSLAYWEEAELHLAWKLFETHWRTSLCMCLYFANKKKVQLFGRLEKYHR